MKQPPPPPSKLFIRSEVLAVVEFLTTLESPSKQDKLKQLRRLSAIEDRASVLEILVKELQRANKPEELQSIAELLMELGSIESLQGPLWDIIRNPETTDEIKDAANLTLHHLGDDTDPDLYLEYLEDPQGLINRETERMLEISSVNPEALIDFIDFIYSLPVDEQCNLLESLQADYEADYLLNIMIPALKAAPPTPVPELILRYMGQSRSKRAALCLKEIETCYEDEPELQGILQKAIKELRFAGIYREELFDVYREELKVPHPLVQSSKLHQCFITIPDGIGNQGVVVSRKQENGDIVMMSVAINDLHGVIDCFGFYQLSEADFNKITEKFHEECGKIVTPPAYCLQRLEAAEALNAQNRFRLPYEYSCWKVLLDDINQEPVDLIAHCRHLANPQWDQECANLYDHPDFATWFLETGDHPVVDEILQDVNEAIQSAVGQGLSHSDFQDTMEVLAEAVSRGLMNTFWKQVMIQRLADTAYLLSCQKTTTYAKLAATEVIKLVDSESGQYTPTTGFIRQYGRRCIEEELLRLKHKADVPQPMLPFVDHVLKQWER